MKSENETSRRLYECRQRNYDFIPFAVDEFGHMGDSAQTFLQQLAAQTAASRTDDFREGSDEAHALDVAIIQATRVGLVTTMGKNCAEAARLLRELTKETDNDAPTNWSQKSRPNRRS